MPNKSQIIISQTPRDSSGQVSQEFMDSLMKFQYGETYEESNEGWESLVSIIKPSQILRIQSIAWVISNYGLEPDDQQCLSKIEKAHQAFGELAKKEVFLGNYHHSLYSSSTFYYPNFKVLVENGIQYANESAAHIITLAGLPERVEEILGRVSQNKHYHAFHSPRNYPFPQNGIQFKSISQLEEFLKKC